MKLSYSNFRGVRPKKAAHLLENSEAVQADAVKLKSGELRTWDNELFTQDLESSEEIETIFLYLGQYWFEFTADVDIQAGPVALDTAYRMYYTGDGIPKKTNLTEAITGSGALPINFYPIGVPIPAVAITAALGAGGAGDARDVAYAWTVVTSWGEESAPSDVSNIVSALQGQTVNLSGMTLVWQPGKTYTVNNWVFPVTDNGYVYKCVTAGVSGAIEPPWGSTIDGNTTDNTVVWRCYKKNILTDSGAEKRIYRANTGSASRIWSFLDSITMAATTYEDTTEDDDLGATLLPSYDVNTAVQWDPPPDTLQGLVACSGGFFAGFVGKDLYFSEPYYPHAWPYRLPLPYTIVGLAVKGNYLYVMTDSYPYAFIGTHPLAMTPEKLANPKQCASKQGIVTFDRGVLYPSNVSLEWIEGNEQKSVLDLMDAYSKDEWEAIYPATMKATFHNGCYIAFYKSGETEGGIVIDVINGIISTLPYHATAVYTDIDTDTMYYTKRSYRMLLLESGTPYPTRTNIVLLESGDNILME